MGFLIFVNIAMEVVGKSKAHVVLDSCLHESVLYFSDHTKLMNCNPYCSNVKHLIELDMFQWVFQVADPRNNPITAVFFVRQVEEAFSFEDSYGQQLAARVKSTSSKGSACPSALNFSGVWTDQWFLVATPKIISEATRKAFQGVGRAPE